MTAARGLRRLTVLTAAAATLAAVIAVVPATAQLSDTGTVGTALTSADDEPLLFTGGVEAGDAHSVGWTADGELYAWGRNQEGQLGLGTADHDRLHPTRVALPAGRQVVDVCAGADATVALTADDGVYAWGGSGWANNSATPRRTDFFDTLGDPVVKVEAGAYFYLALTASGRLYSWGIVDSRLGRPVSDPNGPPALVQAQSVAARDVTTMSAGRFHAAAIVDGQVVAWGSTTYAGVTGVVVTGIEGEPVEVAAGNDVTVVRTAEGRVYVARGSQATLVDGISGIDGVAVSSPVLTGGSPSFWAWRGAPSGRRTLYVWGDDSHGQLGLGIPGLTHVETPLMVGLPVGSVPLRVAGGGGHALYESTTGQYAATGLNDRGQLGDGTRDSRSMFVYVIPISRWP